VMILYFINLETPRRPPQLEVPEPLLMVVFFFGEDIVITPVFSPCPRLAVTILFFSSILKSFVI